MTTSEKQLVIIRLHTGSPFLLMNRERASHWSKRATEAKQWRQQAAMFAKARFTAATFQFTPLIPEGKAIRFDTGAVFPTTKAILDGLVDAGVIPDDNRFHHMGEAHFPPEHAAVEFPTMHVIIREEPPTVGHGPEQCRCKPRSGR